MALVRTVYPEPRQQKELAAKAKATGRKASDLIRVKPSMRCCWASARSNSLSWTRQAGGRGRPRGDGEDARRERQGPQGVHGGDDAAACSGGQVMSLAWSRAARGGANGSGLRRRRPAILFAALQQRIDQLLTRVVGELVVDVPSVIHDRVARQAELLPIAASDSSPGGSTASATASEPGGQPTWVMAACGGRASRRSDWPRARRSHRRHARRRPHRRPTPPRLLHGETGRP